MGTHYHLPGLGVNSAPISGRYLAHNQQALVVRAFFAADLLSGAKQLTNPTLVQSAWLARVNRAYAYWAEKRMAERAEIEAGLIPLVPAPLVPKANGNASPMSITVQIPDCDLFDFVRTVGVNRVLEAAVAVEAAE
jgi:hypothetical protein